MGAQTSNPAENTSSPQSQTSPLHVAVGLCFDDLADSEGAVTAAAFEHLFSGPVAGFGSRLFVALFGKGKPRISKLEFVRAVHKLMSCDSRQLVTIVTYLEVFSDGDVLVEQVLSCACKLALKLPDTDSASGEEPAPGNNLYLAAASSTICGSEENPRDLKAASVASWIVDNMPGVFDSVHGWVERAVWSSSAKATDLVPFALPRCVSMSSKASISSELLNEDGIWVLSTLLPPCFLGHHVSKTAAATAAPVSSTGASTGGQWNILYNSRDHGLSLNRFKHHVLDYQGPNLCCIRCDQGKVIVIGVDGEWRESSSTWGGPDCMLVQIAPNIQPLASGSKLLLFNEKTRGVRLGLSVGRDMSSPDVHLDENLDKLTLRSSLARLPENLCVRGIEVWGCGGADLQAAQQRQKEWDKQQVEKRRKVKRPGRWEENPDALLLEWGGVHTTSNFQHERKKDDKPK